MRRALLLGLVLSVAVFTPRTASAQYSAMTAEATDVASSFDGKNIFDFRFRVRYDHTEKRAQIKRELQQAGADTTQSFKDLVYQSHQDSLALRAEFGLFHDLMLHAELPIVIDQSEAYAFDHSAGGSCVFPPQMFPNCVNASNSTTVADGIAPAEGFDAQNGGMPLGMSRVMQGPLRGARGGSGLDSFDTINLGVTWGPLSQTRDPSKPNWIVGFEAQISIGNIKKFDRSNPDGNHAVSEGVHRFIFKTALSRRFRYFEPYWDLWYLLPVARGDSLFIDYGRAQKTKDPQMQGGTYFGTEIIPYEHKEKQYRFALDLRMRVQGHFQGRGYSEAWQLLASSPALVCDASIAGYNPACDPTSPSNPYQGKPFTGITTIQDYATVGADVALAGQIGPNFRIRAGFQYSHDQAHFITGDDIGTPLPNSPTGRVMAPEEYNPAYRAVIDQPGRRYQVDSVNVYNIYVGAQAMF